jgi:hypothetical protein
MIKRGKNFVPSILIVFAVMMLINLASAEVNVTTKAEASRCINQSEIIMQQMILDGFNVIRINDSLKQAQLLYNSQVILLERKSKYDFSPVISYCSEISQINQIAVSARDEFNALLGFYNESLIAGMNTASIDVIINEIRDEINSERYEKVKPLVDSAYNEIINVKSAYTAVNVFLASTTKSFSRFLLNNWKIISGTLLVLIILFIIYRLRIMRYLINRQIQGLELRKKTIRDLIMRTQKDYFEGGKISEGEYNIKTKKFAELVRDIDRQIPTLREELARLEKRKAKKI